MNREHSKYLLSIQYTILNLKFSLSAISKLFFADFKKLKNGKKFWHEWETTYLNGLFQKNMRKVPIKAKKGPYTFLLDTACPLYNLEFAAILSNLVKIANFQSYFCPWQFRNDKIYINLHNVRPKNPILTYSTVFWNGPYLLEY